MAVFLFTAQVVSYHSKLRVLFASAAALRSFKPFYGAGEKHFSIALGVLMVFACVRKRACQVFVHVKRYAGV